MTDHRQQAIRDVAAAFMLSTSYINDCLVKPYTCDDERIAYAVAQREKVLALEARERWISVKDRMPGPEKDWYLITDGKRCDIGRLLHGKTFMGHALQFSDVTHWKPQPAPPAEAQLQQKEVATNEKNR